MSADALITTLKSLKLFGMAGAGLLLSVARQATVRPVPPHPPASAATGGIVP